MNRQQYLLAIHEIIQHAVKEEDEALLDLCINLLDTDNIDMPIDADIHTEHRTIQ